MAKKKEVVDIGLEEDGSLEPRVYELGFHLDPELAQEEVKKTYASIRDRIAAVGTIIAEGEPTKIPLAYRISRGETTGRRDFDSAFFCWIAYEADSNSHEEVATLARENSSIVRFIDIRTSVEEAKHSAEMQEMFARAALDRAEDEVAELDVEVAPAQTEEPVA